MQMLLLGEGDVALTCQGEFAILTHPGNHFGALIGVQLVRSLAHQSKHNGGIGGVAGTGHG